MGQKKVFRAFGYPFEYSLRGILYCPAYQKKAQREEPLRLNKENILLHSSSNIRRFVQGSDLYPQLFEEWDTKFWSYRRR